MNNTQNNDQNKNQNKDNENIAKEATKVTENITKEAAKANENIAKEAIKANENIQHNYDNYAKMQKESLDSLSSAFNIWVKGVEELNKEFFERAQNAVEKNINDSKNISDAKDPQEFYSAQSGLLTKAFSDMISTSSFISEKTAKIANSSFQPVQKQINKNWDIFSKYLTTQ